MNDAKFAEQIRNIVTNHASVTEDHLDDLVKDILKLRKQTKNFTKPAKE